MSNDGTALNNDWLIGQLVRLAAPNPATDAEAMARWSLDTEYHRLGYDGAAYPMSAKQMRARLERDNEHGFDFAIRLLQDDRLIGDIGVWIASWAQGEAWVGIGIGVRDCWSKGYGTEAMRLLLRFAFNELNLQRVSLGVFAHNLRAVRSYEKAGFRHEGQVRGDCQRDGQRWDTMCMGILREEWLKRKT